MSFDNTTPWESTIPYTVLQGTVYYWATSDNLQTNWISKVGHPKDRTRSTTRLIRSLHPWTRSYGERSPDCCPNQIAWATGQRKNKWTKDSSSTLHKGQTGSPKPTLQTKFRFVGRASLPICQRSILSLSWSLSFQTLFHWISELVGEWFPTCILYTEWTENIPLGSRVHTSLSGWRLAGILILLMALTESSSSSSLTLGKSLTE